MLPNLNSTEYYEPLTIKDAVKLLKENKAGAKIIAGGTDVLVQVKNKKITPQHLISISKIDKLKKIYEEDNQVVIGAGVTHEMIENSTIIKDFFPVLIDGASQVGSVQIRNLATVVGNICNSAPSADTAPPLLVLDAKVKTLGENGSREIALNQFFTGPGKNVLIPGELVTHLIIPKDKGQYSGCYMKFSRRKAMDLAMVGAAVYINWDNKKNCILARIALGTSAPIPMRAYKSENYLKNKMLNEENIIKTAQTAAEEASPRSSWRAGEEYRRKLIEVLVKRAFFKALERV